MSYFPGFVGPGKEWRSFLWHISSHGESVVYSLDRDGKSTGMTAGGLEDDLESCLREHYPDAVVNIKELNPYQFDCSTWEELVGILNGKKGSKAARIRSLYQCIRYLTNVERYVQPFRGKYQRTEVAKQWDRHRQEAVQNYNRLRELTEDLAQHNNEVLPQDHQDPG